MGGVISLDPTVDHFTTINEGFRKCPYCIGDDPMVICFPQSSQCQLNLATD